MFMLCVSPEAHDLPRDGVDFLISIPFTMVVDIYYEGQLALVVALVKVARTVEVFEFPS